MATSTERVTKDQVGGLFPASLSKDESKFTSEKNITGIIRAVVDKNSYIISYNSPTCEFVIDGYYFKIDLPNLEGNDLWASIVIDENNRLIGHNGNPTTDIYEGDTFNGVVFSNGSTRPDLNGVTAPSYTQKDLHLKVNGEINKAEFVKFNGESISVNLPESSDDKVYSLVVNPDGTLSAQDMTSSNPTTASATNTFVTNITQDSSGQITIEKATLSKADNSNIGGIKTGYSQSGKNYPVQVTEDGKAYVNVPWSYENTTYSAGTGLILNDDTQFNLKPASSGEIGGIKIGYTTNETNRNYAVQLDSGKAYVNVPWSDTHTTVTSSYSETGTDAVNGKAVKAALQTLDSSIAAESNKAISAISIVDGKINSHSKVSIPQGTVTGVIAGTGLSGGGTSGSVTLNHSNTILNSETGQNSGTEYSKIYRVTFDDQGHVKTYKDGLLIGFERIRSNQTGFQDIAASATDKSLSGGTIVHFNTVEDMGGYKFLHYVGGSSGGAYTFGINNTSGVYKIYGSLYFDSLSSEVTDYGIYVYYNDQELGGVLYPKPTGRTFSGAVPFSVIIDSLPQSQTNKGLTVLARLRGTGGTGRIHLDSTMTEFYVESVA